MVFKEEMMEFAKLEKLSHETGTASFRTDRDQDRDNLEALRNWMKNMTELKLSVEVHNNERIDSYFIAFELDEGYANGVVLKITTRNQGNHKRVLLDSYCYRMREAEFNRKFG